MPNWRVIVYEPGKRHYRTTGRPCGERNAQIDFDREKLMPEKLVCLQVRREGKYLTIDQKGLRMMEIARDLQAAD
jgi:hypothetical protein